MNPAHYPDPYPSFRPVPALSSGASSASTRSSAYTSSGSALPYVDYSNVHVASPDDDAPGIPSDALLQMLASDPAHSSSARGPILRSPDRSRWSEANSAGLRSRSSSLGNGLTSTNHNHHPDTSSPPTLSQKPSYDVTWQTVHERDEILMSEEETDDEPTLDSVDIEESDEKYEERTSAAVVADEGRGLIVNGDSVPIVQLQIQPGPRASISSFSRFPISLPPLTGTTHLLIGSSPTPNAVPSFLTSVLPQIAHSLLALDISANFLGALPPVLAICESLEELNVASNPLRVLPVFLADLSNLRVLIADSTGINTLPEALVDLDKLHTISIRRNKLHALPSWLCLLPALQTLCLDGNPFQGPWKALVDPLMAKVPTTPIYPPSTPMLLPLSAGVQSTGADTETDVDDFSDHEGSSPRQVGYVRSPEEEDHTITPERGPFLSRATTSPLPLPVNPPVPTNKPLTRTRTTPNRSYFDQSRSKPSPPLNASSDSRPQPQSRPQDAQQSPNNQPEIRKMKSAGDLRRGKSANAAPEESHNMPRPPLSKYPTSLSSSNLLQMGDTNTKSTTLAEEFNRRFASLGPVSQFGSPSRMPPNAARPLLSQSMWEEGSPEAYPTPPPPSGDGIARASSYSPANPPPAVDGTARSSSYSPGNPPIQPQGSRDPKLNQSQNQNQRQRPPTRDKTTRWGFLKKMSMGKIKPDPPPSTSSSPSSSPNPARVTRPQTSNGVPSSQFGSISRGFDRTSKSPQIDVRLSSTGTLDALPVISPPPPSAPNPPPRLDSLTIPSTNLLSPTTPRTTKRRSFLPVEAPGAMSLTIPENSPFVSNVVVAHDAEEQPSIQENRSPNPSPSPTLDHEQYIRREEDRVRDAYMRALRSVMAYLKDMNDLGTSQQSNVLSMYGSSAQDEQVRSRRPTIVDRESSALSSGSTLVSLSDASGHLRSADSIAGNRSGTSSQTLSVATTDSNGSSEERKFKDDKGKRAMVIREIIL